MKKQLIKKRVPTMLRITILVCLVVLTALPSVSGGVIFNRPYVAGSETTWAPGGTYIVGDDFTLGSSATINSISVWIAGQFTATTNPNQEQSAIRLFVGADPGPLNLLSSTYSFTNVGTFANPNLLINQPVFELTFSGLNFAATGGTLYDFGVEGTPAADTIPLNLFAINPVNATTPGPGDGADGLILAFTGTPGTGPYNFSFTTPSDPSAALAGDINVQISAAAVPEPSTLALFGFGAIATIVLRRRRR